MDNSEKAAEIFNRHAVQYAERFMNFDNYNFTFDVFCNAIEKHGASLLELASGPGNITKYLLSKRPDLQILATDLAPNMLELAKKHSPSIETKVLDCRKFLSLNKKFDAIMCGFGLPYLTKQEAIQLIQDASLALNSKGVFYLSTMEDDNNNSAFKTGSSGEAIFMNYHEADYLTEALIKNSFEIIDLQRKDFTNPDGSIAIDLMIVAKKSNI